MKTGHPETAFCNSWKGPHIAHEVCITDFCLKYPDAEFVRFTVEHNADFEMKYRGIRFFGEFDSGEQTLTQVNKRQESYAGVREFLLYVTVSERRLNGLLKCSDGVKDIALFTTLDQVLREPHGEIWVSVYGNRASL